MNKVLHAADRDVSSGALLSCPGKDNKHVTVADVLFVMYRILMQMHITVQQVARVFNQEIEVVAIIKYSFPGKCVRVEADKFQKRK